MQTDMEMQLFDVFLVPDLHDELLCGVASAREVHSELEAAIAVGFYLQLVFFELGEGTDQSGWDFLGVGGGVGVE